VKGDDGKISVRLIFIPLAILIAERRHVIDINFPCRRKGSRGNGERQTITREEYEQELASLHAQKWEEEIRSDDSRSEKTGRVDYEDIEARDQANSWCRKQNQSDERFARCRKRLENYSQTAMSAAHETGSKGREKR
jgi:hypothetical protein